MQPLKKCFVAIAFCVFACAMFAQQNQMAPNNNAKNGGGNSSATSTSTSNSGANASTGSSSSNNNVTFGGSDNRQFINALPGTAGNPGPFPGVPLNNGDWQLYAPGSVFLVEDIDASHKKYGKKNIRCFGSPRSIEANRDPIHSINWWSEDAGYFPNDRVLTECSAIVEPRRPKREVLEALLSEAKEQTHSRRCSIHYRTIGIGVTSGFSLGGSGAAAARPGSAATAAAGGGMIGKNKVRREEQIEFDVICLNDGPNEAPIAAPRKAEAAVAAPPQPQPEKEPEATPQQPSRVPVNPAPPMAVTPEANVEPTVMAAPCAGLPQFVVYFPFNNPRGALIIEDNLAVDRHDPSVGKHQTAAIKRFADWLLDHPRCLVQVEGHASIEGSYSYNDALGARRAKALYDALVSYGGNRIARQLHNGGSDLKEQLLQSVSLGKRMPASEYQPKNRRAFVRAIGEASSH